MSLLDKLVADRVASRIWQRDPSVFTPDGGPVHDAIRGRLGWLDAPAAMRAAAAEARAFAAEVLREGVTDVCLLGMGGSSLCAEVLRDTAPRGVRGASLVVLDTTDERAVRRTADTVSGAHALFLVASKSGTTIEVRSLENFFWGRTSGLLGDAAGGRFAAITDPGTQLAGKAAAHRYRHTFLNPPDIGGRYSALSLFGLVPAALLGLDTDALLGAAVRMADRCGGDDGANPALTLGAYMAEQALAGRDKLTLILPPASAPMGPWIEQLIAESTGKLGRGILPVVDEVAGPPGEYGMDRAFVFQETGATPDDVRRVRELEAAGHPVFRLEAEAGLGGEFFRWEFATAVAGAGLRINPFDEPNVREAKTRTKELLDGRDAGGTLRIDPPLEAVDGLPGCRVRTYHPAAPARDPAGRYVAILDYLPSDSSRRATIDALRGRIRARTRLATTHGIGPRYLHSTGQYHKGGPNTGVFVLLTAEDETVTAVPEADYSFSVLKRAQALGDFRALAGAGRQVVHLHFTDPPADVVPAMERLLWSPACLG